MSDEKRSEALVKIFEDGLDVVMLVGSVIYAIVLYETQWQFSQKTMAAIGGTGGTLRLILRRLIRRIVELKVGDQG